jgi:predicted ATPase
LAETLLKSCPHTRILATSRDILHLEGEVSFHVPSLTTPTGEDMKLLESAAGFEAVRLFSERARLVLPNFGITKENFPLIAEICNYLDGIPLAIELAAALVDIFNLEEVLDQLNRPFDLLASNKRAVLPRHQTMRASLDWSWNLLIFEKSKSINLSSQA